MEARPPAGEFGSTAPEFSLPDTKGKLWGVGDLRGPRGLLVVFICNHCPYVISIGERLARDARMLQDTGFGVAAICSNDAETYPQDSFENMGPFAEKYGFSFPYLHDADQSIAKAFGAVCTPDFFGFNAFLELQYRGRLDGSGMSGQDTPSELVPAMELIAKTGQGPKDQVPSIGCSIKWKAA